MGQASETREELLEATYRVLAAHSFAGLTTQRVADEAGRSQSLVHYHYDTKEDLVVAFLGRIRAGESDWLSELVGGTAEERLRRFVEMQLSIPRDDEHGQFNVAFLELEVAASRNERYAAALRGFSELVQDTLADIIRDGIESGEFREVDPEVTARFLRYALHGAVAEDLTLDVDRAKTETRAAVETYVEQVVLAETD